MGDSGRGERRGRGGAGDEGGAGSEGVRERARPWRRAHRCRRRTASPPRGPDRGESTRTARAGDGSGGDTAADLRASPSAGQARGVLCGPRTTGTGEQPELPHHPRPRATQTPEGGARVGEPLREELVCGLGPQEVQTPAQTRAHCVGCMHEGGEGAWRRPFRVATGGERPGIHRGRWRSQGRRGRGQGEETLEGRPGVELPCSMPHPSPLTPQALLRGRLTEGPAGRRAC